MSSKEFEEWQYFYALEPFGEFKRDLHAGMIASTIANSAGLGLVKHRRTFAPKDFIYDFERSSETTLERAKRLRVLVVEMNAAMGGTVNGKRAEASVDA